MTQRRVVKIVEVGPRDGLQNIKTPIETDVKVALINALSQTGLKVIEAGALVSPQWVPQMADSDIVYQRIDKKPGIRYPVLVPNEQGLNRALALNVKEIAIFVAASETFSHKNTNKSIEERLAMTRGVVQKALEHGLDVRGYLSTVIACPYEGRIAPQTVVPIVKTLFEIGCYEVSLGDTIGVATPDDIRALLKVLTQDIDPLKLAMHFHDTNGRAIDNIAAGLEFGLLTIDSSLGGLGGCPYAPGAKGNVSTQDVIAYLDKSGFEHGVDLEMLNGVEKRIDLKKERGVQSALL